MTKESFGAFITERRERAGISKAELARRTGMTRAYIGFIEEDSQPPGMGPPNVSAKNLSALARELSVSEPEMFERGYRSPAGFKLVPSGSPAEQLVREHLAPLPQGDQISREQVESLAQELDDIARVRVERITGQYQSQSQQGGGRQSQRQKQEKEQEKATA